MQNMITMKKYTQDEREKAIKEIEATPIKPEEWEGPHETKITSFRYVDDVSDRKKKGLFSGLVGRIKSMLHPA